MLDWTWILTAVIGLLTLYVVHYLLVIWSLPPGPFPLPILGNILAFRGKGNEFSKVLDRLHRKHKDIFTLWLGPRPTIFVCSWDLCHEALINKKNDFSGRVRRHSIDYFIGPGDDVAFSDFGPAWETLRKVLSGALRRYVMSDSLAELVSDVVDRTIEEMTKDGEPVDAKTFMYLNIYNVLASSAFGVRFDLNDPIFLQLKKNDEELNEKFGNGTPTDALPFLKIFYRKRLQELENLTKLLQGYIDETLKEHKKTYQSGEIRDFADAVLAAKEEAETEGKESLPYLTEINLRNTLVDMFAAGTDTTRRLLMWLFLIISNKTEIQRKMQNEIDSKIGSRQPVQKDKASCPYISAVLTETLRYRPSLDITLEHKSTCDTELGGYKIPKDTSVVFYIKGSHMNNQHWEEPEIFKPERFLDKEEFTSTHISNYMPFGLGRRACPGEKLALLDTFLIITRILQKHDIELENGPGSVDMNVSNDNIFSEPVPYRVLMKKREYNN